MKITPITAVGDARAPCEFKIRIANPLMTRSAKYSAHQRKERGLPIDQCGARGDYLVDGTPHCRAHAGQMALNHVLTDTAGRARAAPAIREDS